MSRPFLSGPSRLEPTPPEVFFNRRQFVAGAAVGAAALSCVGRAALSASEPKLLEPPLKRPQVFPAERNAAYGLPTAIARKELTPREVAASHNNFYEFLPGRGGPVWKETGAFEVEPWKVEVAGECHKPQTFDLDDLSNINPNIPHPRWSQSESFWLDTEERFPTPLFNGYADQVGKLYPDEPTTPQAPLRPGQTAR
ncbi:MAG: hypothetical protein ACRD2Z_17300 [Thermoanaerobaculia bacterium]